MEEVDWVKAREACSTAEMFEKLKREVEKDVDERNKQLPAPADYAFKVVDKGDSLTVLREAQQASTSVVFSLDGRHIVVKQRDRVLFSATVTLNDEGECRFKINGEEKQSWHLRKLALEDIFFLP